LHKKNIQLKIFLAFSAIYILWGSTYLANKYAIETIPPIIVSGLRFLIAGTILYAIERPKVKIKPKWAHWKESLIIGFLMLSIGNGGIVWAQKKVPSGLTALLVSSTPIWLIIIDWLRPNGVKPKKWVIFGIILGFTGIAFLISPDKYSGENSIDFLGFSMLLIASIAWASGTMYSRHAHIMESPFLSISMHMLCGGTILILFSLIIGDFQNFNPWEISIHSIIAVSYLVVAGSLLGFTAYLWLMRKKPPVLVSTNSFINPVVAIFIGWAIAGEIVTLKMLIASVIIIISVIVITINNFDRKEEPIITSKSTEPIEPV
jgi:drug/metabolite transporter (DMT)-like permease